VTTKFESVPTDRSTRSLNKAKMVYCNRMASLRCRSALMIAQQVQAPVAFTHPNFIIP